MVGGRGLKATGDCTLCISAACVVTHSRFHKWSVTCAYECVTYHVCGDTNNNNELNVGHENYSQGTGLVQRAQTNTHTHTHTAATATRATNTFCTTATTAAATAAA